MIPDPSTAESQLGEGGSDNPVGEGSGTETPSPAGHRQCEVIDCAGRHYGKGLCRYHYDRWINNRAIPERAAPVVVVCPDDLVPLVTRLVEIDAAPVFMLLWRAVAHWHLAESAAR